MSSDAFHGLVKTAKSEERAENRERLVRSHVVLKKNHRPSILRHEFIISLD